MRCGPSETGEVEPFTPINLIGSIVGLDPLTLKHVGPLARVGLDPELWRLQPRTVASTADMRVYVETALADQEAGMSLPFVVVSQFDGSLIGCTRFMDISVQHRRVEIGATWFTPTAQRTGAFEHSDPVRDAPFGEDSKISPITAKRRAAVPGKKRGDRNLRLCVERIVRLEQDE